MKGRRKVDLTWSGATGTSVEVHRQGGLLVSTANDGAYQDSIDGRGSGGYRYRICEAGGTVCSAEVQVNF